MHHSDITMINVGGIILKFYALIVSIDGSPLTFFIYMHDNVVISVSEQNLIPDLLRYTNTGYYYYLPFFAAKLPVYEALCGDWSDDVDPGRVVLQHS